MLSFGLTIPINKLNMKNIILLILIQILCYSCTKNNFKLEYYPDGNLKSKMEVNHAEIPNGKFEKYYPNGNLKRHTIYKEGVVADTIYHYYKNGKIKEKGVVIADHKFDWWFYYDSSGILSKKTEYLIIDGKSYANQNIHYDKEGKINYSLSSFFTLHLEDTLSIGKNIGRMDYFSNSKNFDLQFIYIIIENEYSNGVIKKDTFTDDIDKLWFGVNAYKKGVLKIKGTIQEELAKEKLISKDSSELIISKHNKYFEKDVYVIE